MSDRRDRRIDAVAIFLMAWSIFACVALASYNASDPVLELAYPFNRLYQPDPISYPVLSTPRNLCGAAGALAADVLLRCFGLVAWFFAFSGMRLAWLLLRPRPVIAPLVRLSGWTVALVGLCTVAQVAGISVWNGPVLGPGGVIGSMSQAMLSPEFGPVGTAVLAAACAGFGLLLCTDFVLWQLVTTVTGGVWGGVKSLRRGRVEASEGDEDEASPARPKGLSIRFGKKRQFVEEHEEDADDDEEWDADDELDEEYDEQGVEESVEQPSSAGTQANEPSVSTAAAGGLKRLIDQTSKLRVRKPAAKPAADSGEEREVDERQEVIEQLEEASRHEETKDYDLPTSDLLLESDDFSFDQQEKEVRRKAKILEKTFQDFGFTVKVVEIETGPVIAQYEIELEAGLRLSKITGLADDLAIALRVPSVRIVAPIPGKNTVGIEVPNEQRQVVRLREVMDESDERMRPMRIPLFIGKDVSGNALAVDLSTLPHLLIAGRTGTGKSVCLNAIISSILMTKRPDEVRMLMIDPKMVELSGYKTLPHLMHPVVTDMRKAEAILAWAVDKMEERYELLARAGVRHVSVYNQLGEEELMERLQPCDEEERAEIPLHLPFIVIVADEMADLMMTAGKEVEQHIIRLAQKSRAVGIHLILATQKPTVDVITGLIKSNLPARIAFQVASRTDSRVVLDEMGAEKLLGNGDMLFLWPGTSMLVRGQGTYLSDDEINRVVEQVSTGEQNFVKELVQLKVEDPTDATPGELKNRDELYESAVEIVIREGRGSVSLLQRCLGIGYGRAARLIDYMAEDGIVGPYNGSQAREVVLSLEQWQTMQSSDPQDDEPKAAAQPKKKRGNKVKPSDQDVDQMLDEYEEDDQEDGSNTDQQTTDDVDDDIVDEILDDDDGEEVEYEEDDEAYEDEDDEYEDDEDEDGEYYEEDEEDEPEDEPEGKEQVAK